MGYVPNRTTYVLDFGGDPDYDGLEVSAYAGSLGQYMEISKLADFDLHAPINSETANAMNPLFEAFGAVLVRWNIEQPRGKKVPATVAGLKSLEAALAMRIIEAWLDAVVGKASPLDGTDLELPVEPLTS